MSPAARRRRRWPRRVLGLVFLVVLLELALQAAGPLVQRAMARREGPPDPDAPLTILCVGDSNTFGLHMPRVYAYPSQLAARLDRRYARPVSVINRGVPGRNGAQVARDLRADITATQADMVLVLVGINDTWNRTAESDGLAGLLASSRLVRLVRVLTAGVTTAGRFEVTSNDQGQIQVDRGDGPEQVNATGPGGAVLEGEMLAERVRAGLLRVLDVCLDHGAEPVLMTYPEFQGEYGVVNAAIRGFAVDHDVLLVDHERAFQPHFERDGYETLMLNDHHPNLRGYQLMASIVDAGLADAGHVPPVRTDATTDGPRVPASPPQLAKGPGGTLVLSGPAGWSWQLLIGRTTGAAEALTIGEHDLPMLDDAVLALARLEPTFSGRFESNARIEIDVPPRLLAEAGDSELAACLVLLRDVLIEDAGGASPVAAVSDAVRIEP